MRLTKAQEEVIWYLKNGRRIFVLDGFAIAYKKGTQAQEISIKTIQSLRKKGVLDIVFSAPNSIASVITEVTEHDLGGKK